MKKISLIFSIILCSSFFSCGNYSKNSASNILIDIPTTQNFLQDEVKAEDLTKILTAGVNCQSGMNGQPWHFSAIKNKEILKRLSEEMQKKTPSNLPDDIKKKDYLNSAPLAIVVSGKSSSAFDCALATQIMACEAELLGYGTKILGSINIILHGENKSEYKELLKIPANMETVVVLLVGKAAKQKTDAISSASTRKDFSEVVSIIE